MDQPYNLAKQLEADIRRILAPIDRSELGRPAEGFVNRLQHGAIDIRLDARDYELAETRTSQMKLATVAKSRLELLRHDMVEASQHNIFSAIEIAHLSTIVDRIIDQLV